MRYVNKSADFTALVSLHVFSKNTIQEINNSRLEVENTIKKQGD